MGTSEKNRNKVVFDCCKNSEYKELAAYHAELTNSDLIETEFSDLPNILKKNNFEYCTVVIEPSNIYNDILTQILILQNEYDETSKRFFWGILTGRNPEILNALIVKNDIFKTYFSDEFVLINRTDYNTKEIKKQGNTTTMYYYNATTENLKSIQDKHPINALSVIGHGRDDVIWMTDGCICGKSKVQERDETKSIEDSFLPLCAFEDRCFMREGNILYVYEILSRHLFINACKSSKLGGCVFDECFNAAFSFFEGNAISHIGCNASIMGQETSNYYYAAQMRLGSSLGEITANLSKMYRDQNMPTSEAYYLLGDPTFCNLTYGKCKEVDIDKLSDDGTENRFEFEIEEDLEMIMVNIPYANFEDEFFNLRWQLMGYFYNQRAWGVFHKIDKDKTQLRVFSDYTIKSGEKLILIIQRRKDYCPDSIFAFTQFLDMGFVDNKLKMPILEAKEVALKLLGRYEHNMNIINSVYKDTYKRLDKLFKRVPALSKLLVEYFVEKTHKTGFCWEEYVSISGMKFTSWDMDNSHGRCSNCNRLLTRKEYTHIYHKQIRRYQYDCPVCGFVQEIPAEDEKLHISIEGDCHIKLGCDLTQKIVFHNENDIDYIGCVGISIVDGKDFMVSYLENIIPVSINAHNESQVIVSLSIDKEARPHQYWLKIYIVLNGKMVVLKRDIWVIP